MNTAFKRVTLPVLALTMLASSAGAQQYVYQPNANYYRNDTAEGTVAGGAFGAITGALIGGRGNRGEGALIGAGVGAIAGRLLGKQQDQFDAQEAAVGRAVAADASVRAAQAAVTNLDLIQLSQAGLSEEVIIGAIRNRGGRFDLSPQSLISLKQNGVSDRVVAAAQNLTISDGAPPARVITSGPPVVVRPAPVVRYQIGVGPHYPRRHRGRHFYYHHRW